MIFKKCTRCGEEKPATFEFFPPHKKGRYGIHSRCRPCKKLDDAERRARPDQLQRQQAWRDANKDYAQRYNAAYRAAGYKSTEHVAAWRAANLEYCRARDRLRMRAYRAADPEKHRAMTRRFYQQHRDRIIARMAVRYRTDVHTNLKVKLASRLRGLLRWPGKRSAEMFGFSRSELRLHLERQFTAGMTWDKLLAGDIHIDHIIPVRAFNIKTAGDDEFRACWALSNLRPLWAKDNHVKSGKILTLL